MARSHSEVERKYDVPDGVVVPGLEQIPGVERVQTQDIELDATYFDTDSLDLAAAGITLRRRTGGDDEGWHLKLPSKREDERHELRLPLSRAAKTPPKSFRDTVLVHTRGQTLKRVADIRTHRTMHALHGADGQVLAYFCDDSVTAPTPAPSDTGLLIAWREWEVELAGGPADLLDAADGLVRDAGATPAAGPSKLARVLGDRIPPEGGEAPSRQRAKGPAAAVVLARLKDQLAEMKRLDAQVRLDLPDSVHKMRVAMRRLRSALATFRPMLDREVSEPLRDELRWVSRVLGDARDAEVMHERLRALVAAEPGELVLGGVVSRIDFELGGRYREAHERSLEALRSDRYFALLDGLEALVNDPPWADKALEPVRDVLPRRMRNDWKRLRRRVDAAETADDEHRDLRLHEARKAAKRVRYAAESLEPVYGEDAERFARAAKKVQSALGEHQDSVVTLPLLRQLGVQAYLDGDNGFTFGRLHGLEQCRAQETLGTFDAAWGALDRKSLRRWFR
jgi:CHAD domain-containing protein